MDSVKEKSMSWGFCLISFVLIFSILIYLNLNQHVHGFLYSDILFIYS
jgi:hypothetical protein